MSWRRRVFVLLVFLTLGLAGLFGGMVALMNVQPGFMGMSHFTEAHHRIHDLTFALLNGTTVVGMLAQLRAPARNVAGQLMALVPFAALLLSVVVTNRFVLSPPWLLVGASAVFATMFHPAGDPLRWVRGAHADRVMLLFLAAAAVPLLAFAWTNIGLQRAGPTEHGILGHYGYMAAFSFTVIAVGILSSLRPDGWRLAAIVTGALQAILGAASLILQDVEGTYGSMWGIAAIAWGLGFVAVSLRAEPPAT